MLQLPTSIDGVRSLEVEQTRRRCSKARMLDAWRRFWNVVLYLLVPYLGRNYRLLGRTACRQMRGLKEDGVDGGDAM